MKVLVDTSVWSLALRRKKSANMDITNELKNLIDDSRAQLIGPIRQELLSGIKSSSQFNKLKMYLSAFPDLNLNEETYEVAAEFYNESREKGIQSSNTDFLICAVSYIFDLPIFTTDKDFLLYKKHLPIKLYESQHR